MNSIMGTEAQPCTDAPDIDISLAPDLKTASDISKSILVIMDSKVLDIVADKMFTYGISKKAYNKGLEVTVRTKYPFREDIRSSRPTKEDDDKWYYKHVLEALVMDRSIGHTVFAIEFGVLGGYILKKDCTIHLFTKHLEEQVAFIMPYLEKGIKNYLKTKRDSL
nr:MAG TPA: hypothetical protein [Caudoviricetes sp.]